MKYTTEQSVRNTQHGDIIANGQQKGADAATPRKTSLIRPLAELNVVDNFLFNELTMQEDKEKSRRFCSILAETLLGRKLKNVTITPQRVYQGIDTDKHGICVDVQIESDSPDASDADLNARSEIYDIEPNCYKDDDARRARFYTALIDSHALQSGEIYKNIKDLYLLFITTYDPFGEGSMIYTIHKRCKEYPNLQYDDGVNVVFLYVYGKKNIPSQKIKDMLLFLAETSEENASGDKDREAIYQMVKDIKKSREVGVSYMKQFEYWAMLEKESRKVGLEEGRQEGREEGRQEGRQEGREEGRKEGHEEGRQEGREEERKLSTKVLKHYTLGKTSKEIAEELNIPVDTAEDIIREFEMA